MRRLILSYKARRGILPLCSYTTVLEGCAIDPHIELNLQILII